MHCCGEVYVHQLDPKRALLDCPIDSASSSILQEVPELKPICTSSFLLGLA